MNRKQLKTRVGAVIYPNENNEIDATKHQNLENQILDDVLVKEDDIIGSGSTAEPTEENVFSAIKILSDFLAKKDLPTKLSSFENDEGFLTEISKELIEGLLSDIKINDRYLSKVNPDTAAELITFLKGLTAKDLSTFEKGIKTDEITSISEFISGFLGTGYKIWMDNGSSYFEVDNISVRKEAKFNVLTIEELKSVGGQIIASMANMKCTKVIETEDRYECYFDNDGGNIGNQFRVNDQARCQKFTGSGVKYYWRLVTGVGPDYINLSKTDCDGTGIPEAGDGIVQLGNRSDTSRQNAILISCLEPSIKQYNGIHSYILVGCEQTVISPDGNKLTGQFYVTTDTGVSRVPRDRGYWMDGMECAYYDRLSHNGALWLCVIEEGTTTTEEPSLISTAWEKQVAEGENGTSPILVTIESSQGDNFHNGVISTTLTAKVFSGNEEITSTLNQSCFRWVRTSADTESDAVWNARYADFGSNVLSITSEDVSFKATFNCQVIITT